MALSSLLTPADLTLFHQSSTSTRPSPSAVAKLQATVVSPAEKAFAVSPTPRPLLKIASTAGCRRVSPLYLPTPSRAERELGSSSAA